MKLQLLCGPAPPSPPPVTINDGTQEIKKSDYTTIIVVSVLVPIAVGAAAIGIYLWIRI
jgi:hypothetical protein